MAFLCIVFSCSPVAGCETRGREIESEKEQETEQARAESILLVCLER